MSYLASEVIGMDFSEDILSLSGKYELNERSEAELYVDEQALYDLMIRVFYSEV